MTMIEMKKYDDTKLTDKAIVEMLPELEEKALLDASQEDSIEWAQGMLKHYDPGSIHDMPKYGITLQIITANTARCISVFDHSYCMLMLQMMIATFDHADLTLEVDPYTVLRPYETPEEQDSGHEVTQTAINESFAIEVV
tara:strand:+ start:210 stop:629 length:420 start_codon:yes stop_codon:yes gene_type:complete